MPIIEMRAYDGIPMHCSFYGSSTAPMENDEWKVSGCNYLQVMTSGEFTPFISAQPEKLIVEAVHEVSREQFDIEVSNLADEYDWSGKQSAFVPGLNLEWAKSLGAEFGQNDIVWAGGDAAPQINLLV